MLLVDERLNVLQDLPVRHVIRHVFLLNARECCGRVCVFVAVQERHQHNGAAAALTDAQSAAKADAFS
jgi:hypothetical protein